MKKIVIIGSSGFLGLNLCFKLSKNYKIFPVINKKRIKIKNKNFTYINLKEEKKFINYLKKIEPDYLINCVAYSNVEKCEKYKKYTYDINTNLASKISKICNNLKIHYTFISSDHLYSGKKKFYNEKNKLSPINTYARSKVLAEKKIKKNCSRYLILRTNFYGFGPKFRTTSLVDKIINNLIKKKDAYLLNDVNFTPISIDQFVEILICLLENNKRGTFNISGDQRITKYKFGHKISKKFGLNKKFIKKLYLNDINKDVLRPREMGLSNIKIKKLINKKSLFDLSIGISQLYKSYISSYYKNLKKIK